MYIRNEDRADTKWRIREASVFKFPVAAASYTDSAYVYQDDTHKHCLHQSEGERCKTHDETLFKEWMNLFSSPQANRIKYTPSYFHLGRNHQTKTIEDLEKVDGSARGRKMFKVKRRKVWFRIESFGIEVVHKEISLSFGSRTEKYAHHTQQETNGKEDVNAQLTSQTGTWRQCLCVSSWYT